MSMGIGQATQMINLGQHRLIGVSETMVIWKSESTWLFSRRWCCGALGSWSHVEIPEVLEFLIFWENLGIKILIECLQILSFVNYFKWNKMLCSSPVSIASLGLYLPSIRNAISKLIVNIKILMETRKDLKWVFIHGRRWRHFYFPKSILGEALCMFQWKKCY